MNLVLLLSVLAAPNLDVGAHAGLGLREATSGSGVDAAFAWGLSGGIDLTDTVCWPLRGELLFASDTFMGGDGVEAVDVDSWQGELMLLGGVSWAAWGSLRLQLLAGPGVRLTWVNIRVLEDSSTTWITELFAGVVAGVLYDLGGVQLGLRFMAGVPRPRIGQAYLTGAWRF